MRKGAAAPLVGGAAAWDVTALFAGAARVAAGGDPACPGFSPGGGNGKGGDRIPCCRRLIPASCNTRGGFGAPAARAALENMPVMKKPIKHGTDSRGIAQEFSPVF